MDWTIELDESGGFARVATRGRFDQKDLARMIEAVLSRPFWRPGMAALFDHRELDLGSADYRVMAGAGETHMRFDERIGDGKAALVVRGTSDFGSARQYEQLLGDRAQARLRVFLDIEDAERWLRS